MEHFQSLQEKRCQSSVIAAFLCEPVSHKGIQEGEECLLSNSHQATPLPIWIGDVTMQGGMLTPNS